MVSRKLAKRVAIPATVFITGACVLVIEIVATRILAPYFGNTIFTVSSVISVVLAALSVGYYVGGKLADRHPSQNIFYGIVFAGGLGVFALYWLQILVLPTLGNNLSLTTGPLIVTTVLFFAPSFVLGMLSPFAIKLQEQQAKDQGIGTISGSIFFYSTVGSIFGSLLAGYVLIPHVGVRATVIGVGVVLVVLGLVPMVLLGLDKRFATKVAILVGFGVLFSLLSNPAVQAVYSRDGIYEKITIVDGEFKGRPTRFLFQDRSASGAMFLDSNELAYDYTKYYALYELFTPDPKRVLAIGGGAYSVPKALLNDLPEATVDVAEIEPSLVELSETHFNVPKDEPRLRHHIADGRRLLHDAPEKYDLIFSDVYYSLYAIPMHFTTKEFFQTTYDKLNDNGVFIANIIGSMDRRPPSLVLAEVRTLKAVFPHVYLFATVGTDTLEAQNLMVVAHKSAQPMRLDAATLAASRHQVIRELAPKQVDLDAIDLSPYPLLTDDFAPVESWTAELLRRYGN
jgi:spermidine synthase